MNDVNILNYIPYGKENAISKTDLALITSLNARDVRKCISFARKSAVIINLQDGSGYYRPTAEETADIERWVRQEENREKNTRLATNFAKKILKQNLKSNLNQTIIEGV